MVVCRLLISFAAVAALSLGVGAKGVHAETKPSGTATAEQAKVMFRGWVRPMPAYEYKGVKFSAPAPAVSLAGIEWKKWRSDFRGFEFSKLKDRQLLYAYDLSSLDAKTAGKILEAVRATAEAAMKAEKKPLWAAIGVEYRLKDLGIVGDKGMKLEGEPALLRWATVPVMWSVKFYDLIKGKYDPETFAGVVSGAAWSLPSGTYANYWAVNGWSGSAEALRSKMRDLKGEEIPEGEAAAVNAYRDAVSKGPFKWRELQPVSTFIAVDRELGVKGLKGKAIVTSKLAWPGARK